MTTYQGFLFVKLLAIGSKSEKPGYFLQAYPRKKEDYVLVPHRKNPYGPDPELEKFNGKKVKIEGSETEKGIEIKTIEKISFFG